MYKKFEKRGRVELSSRNAVLEDKMDNMDYILKLYDYEITWVSVE